MTRKLFATLQVAALLVGRPALTQAGDTAFVDVNVVPMDSEQVLPHQTVVLRDGLIAQVGPVTEQKVEAGTKVIKGGGKLYLMPGLADLHTHVETAADLLLYVAHGVTTVLNMGEAPNGIVQVRRKQTETGETLGPHCYVAFLIDGSGKYGHFFVIAPEEARAAVRLAKTNGYDFIKVYNALSPEAFFALVDEARVQHLAVVGHGVESVGLEKQLSAGQVMVAHGEEFLYTTFRHQVPLGLGDGGASSSTGLDEAQIPAAVSFVKKSGAYVIPNLSAFVGIARQWGKPAEVVRLLEDAETGNLRPELIRHWADSSYAKRPGSLDREVVFLRKFTKALSDAGVPLITGTDSPTIPGLFPGKSEHADIEELVTAGLTRFEALSAASRIPGEFIHQFVAGAPKSGTVTSGSRADLLLLRDNPFKTSKALNQIEGVMIGGRWYAKQLLSQRLAAQKQVFEKAHHLMRQAQMR